MSTLRRVRKRSQKGAYMTIVDAISADAENVRSSEAERILGINQEVFLKSRGYQKVDAYYGVYHVDILYIFVLV